MAAIARVVAFIHTLFLSSVLRRGYFVCGIMVMFKKSLPWHAICELASKSMIMTTQKKKAETKNQHYVPQFYLRYFSVDKKNVGAYILKSGKNIPSAPIKGQASRDYFYSDNMEMEKVEGIAIEEKKELTANVHSVESFGNVDGPGIRYVVFFQGCMLRCKYCHNPDTWKMHNPDAKVMTVDQLTKEIVKYREFFEASDGGGVTVSGGESLLQIDFILELFRKLKELGINTCVDTCGGFYVNAPSMNKKVLELISLTDLFLVDIKHIDDEQHLRLTKRTNKNIIQFTNFLSDNGAKMWIRHVLVPKWTDDDYYLQKLREYIDTLNGVERVEVLPYHDMAKFKYKELGIEYELNDINPPTKDRIKNAIEILGARYDIS